MIKAGFLIAGFKGLKFIEKIHRKCEITFVSSYLQKGTLDDSFNNIKSICARNKYRFIEAHNLERDFYIDADIVFVVGWQYIIHNLDDRFIIFHDSLLPRFRGFSPTVSALINGEKHIGVTALKPAESPDGGEIYEQKSVEIEYPIKIKDAYLLLSECYAQIAVILLNRVATGTLKSFPQDESTATYSIWRDELDYFIDWNWSSDKIVRFIDATGWPFYGARAIYQSEEIFIDEAVLIDDLIFEDRHPGKIWLIKNGLPLVVCGKGMIQIVSARNSNGRKFEFGKLRERLYR